MIAVGINNNCQAMMVIHVTKDRSWHHSILGIPNGHAISKQIFTFTMNFQMNLEFPVANIAGLKSERQVNNDFQLINSKDKNDFTIKNLPC